MILGLDEARGCGRIDGRARMQSAKVPAHGHVAEAARCLLDVGFELVQGVVELRVPLLDQVEQRIYQ